MNQDPKIDQTNRQQSPNSTQIPVSEPLGATTAVNTDELIPTSQDSVATETNKRGKNLKVIALLLVFLIVVSTVAYFAYNYWVKDKFADQISGQPVQTMQDAIDVEPLDTSNWSTYLNTVYGYTIDYPADWVTQVLNPDGDTIEASINSESFDIFEPESSYPIGVATFTVLGQLPFYDDSWTTETVEVGESTINKYTTDISEELRTDAYLISLGGGNHLEIVVRYVPGDENERIFKSMISTLELLKKPEALNEDTDTEGVGDDLDF